MFSLRQAARVVELGFDTDPYDSHLEYYARYTAQYDAYQAALVSTMVPTWRDSMYFGAYGVGVGEPRPDKVVAKIGPAPDANPFNQQHSCHQRKYAESS
jgi:hypothetical protein